MALDLGEQSLSFSHGPRGLEHSLAGGYLRCMQCCHSSEPPDLPVRTLFYEMELCDLIPHSNIYLKNKNKKNTYFAFLLEFYRQRKSTNSPKT